jgi:hypothetical protein
MAATSDREIVTQLVAANQQLTKTNQILTEQLKTANDSNALLIAKLGTTKTQAPPPNGSGRATRPPFDHATWLASLDPLGYCWTHGYKDVAGHGSSTCKAKALDHKDEAT